MSKSRKSLETSPGIKPRASTVWVDFGPGTTVLSGISAPNAKGELTFYGQDGEPIVPRAIHVGTSYARPKGPKVVTRVEASPDEILLNPTHTVARHEFVFAVDTNTRRIGGERVSVCASVLLADLAIDGPRWSAKRVFQDTLEFRDALVPPERFGWNELILKILRSGLEGRIAIFVDSEMNELDALNKRESELLPGHLVPPNVTLVYASSDVGRNEHMGNRFLAECDRQANKVLALIEGGADPTVFAYDAPAACARYRFWPAPP